MFGTFSLPAGVIHWYPSIALVYLQIASAKPLHIGNIFSAKSQACIPQCRMNM
jgi:hypothetical protein